MQPTSGALLDLKLIQLPPKLHHLMRASGIGIGKTWRPSSPIFCYTHERGSKSVQRHSADPPGDRSVSKLIEDLLHFPDNRIRIDFGRPAAAGSEVMRHLDTAALQWPSGGVENIPTTCSGSNVNGKHERFERLAMPDPSCGVRHT
jgi:hypothetical protein